jgi:hypothetical protein
MYAELKSNFFCFSDNFLFLKDLVQCGQSVNLFWFFIQFRVLGGFCAQGTKVLTFISFSDMVSYS